jgi:hypothetical protein
MPSAQATIKKRRRARRRKDGRSWRGSLRALAAIAICFTIAYLVAPEWVMAHNPFSQTPGRADPSLAAMRAGSIFIASVNQDTCRQRAFDNMRGLQWDMGVVDCRTAILQSRGHNPVSDRMNSITDAFRQK